MASPKISELVCSIRKTVLISCKKNVIIVDDVPIVKTVLFLVRQYKGHLVGSYHVKCDLSPDDRFLVSGSSDNYGYIWSTNGISSEPLAKLDGHGAEVSAVAWSNFEDLKVPLLF